MRNKENAQDYRHIKEPDIPAIDISDVAASIHIDKKRLPFSIEHELIHNGIHPKDAKFFSADTHKADILFAIDAEVGDLSLTAKTLLNYFQEEDFTDENIRPVTEMLSYYRK